MLRSDRKVIEGPYFRDLMAQPAALADTLAALREPGCWDNIRQRCYARSWRRIVLTGMGASFHGLHPLNLALIELGLAPVMMETSELVHYAWRLCDRETLIIAVSQSGGSAEIVRMLDLNSGSHIVAVTNTADSPLAKRADALLLTRAGPEFSVSCKTYVAAQLMLQWLGAVFADRSEQQTLHDLAAVPTIVDDYLRRWRAHTAVLAGLMTGVRHLYLTGRGPSLAAVGAGALVIKESARYPAEGMSSAAFRHGPMEMLMNDVLTLVFSGAERTRELNQRLVLDIKGRAGRCESIGTASDCEPLRMPAADPILLPILEVLPIQQLTLALASNAGREAGRFEHVTKVTAIE